MPKKKSSELEELAEDQVLVRRVDAMMSTELPEDAPVKPPATVVEPDKKRLTVDMPKDQKTAPQLPPKSLKDTETDEVTKDKITKLETPAKPPLVITLADEANEDKTSEEPTAESKTNEPAQKTEPKADPLEDNATDQAVDDIVSHEGDTVLAVNDALTARQQATAQPGQPSGRSRHKWLWLVILIILLGTAADVAIYLTHR
jgi:hypothetical protein